MRNVSDESCRESQRKSITFFFNPAIYEIMWKKKYCTARQATDDSMVQVH